MTSEKLTASVKKSFELTGKALQSFEEILVSSIPEKRVVIDASIQRFEFTIELFWKLLKKLLEVKGITALYPKDVLRAAFQGYFIDDEKIWLSMLDDRNQTSHTYDEQLADAIFERCHEYAPVMRKTFDKLLQRLDEFSV